MDLEKIRPHFADIAHDLLEGIQAGRFAVGSFLPTEFELRDHYGTSRHTVRAALHELEQLGLVSRRKNVGTRVESAQPTKDFRPTLASVDDLVQFGAEHIRAVQSIEGHGRERHACEGAGMRKRSAMAAHLELAPARKRQ